MHKGEVVSHPETKRAETLFPGPISSNSTMDRTVLSLGEYERQAYGSCLWVLVHLCNVANKAYLNDSPFHYFPEGLIL